MYELVNILNIFTHIYKYTHDIYYHSLAAQK